MSLIDDLRSLAEKVPPSHIPSIGELQSIVGAVITYVEHGAQVLEADADTVSKLLSKPVGEVRVDAAAEAPSEVPQAATAAPVASEGASSEAEHVLALETEIASLRQQLTTAQAVASQTVPAPPTEAPAP